MQNLGQPRQKKRRPSVSFDCFILEILSVCFADDSELLTNLIKLDVVLSAFGEERVNLIVIGLNSGDEGCLRIAVPGFLVPLKRFYAVSGKLFFAHGKAFADEVLFGSLLFLEVLPIDVRHVALKGTAGTFYLVGICRVSVAGGDIEIDDRSVGSLEDELNVVFSIAEGVAAIHVAEYLRHSVIIIKDIQRLIERVRTGVCKVAAVKVETALPVPTSCIAVELNADVNDSAEHARCDNLFNLKEIVCKAALLEYQKLCALFFGKAYENIVFFNGRHEGLFAQHVEAVLQKILGYREVKIAGERVYDDIDIVAVEDFLVVGINVAAVFNSSTLAADFHLIDDRNDLKAFGVLFQVKTVNIAAASALTEYSDSDLFHSGFSFRINDLYSCCYNSKINRKSKDNLRKKAKNFTLFLFF